jgi:PIN domain nuclease of toxin-antitoxin system
MRHSVLDSSAVLAFLKGEPGGEALNEELLAQAAISTVNLAEVQSVLVRDGMTLEEAWEDACSTVASIEPFTAAHAKLAGSLIAQTRFRGLSLGDRACLALAITLDAPVYTADQAWRDLDLGCRIHVIR